MTSDTKEEIYATEARLERPDTPQVVQAPVPETQQTIWDALKENPKVVLYCVSSCLSAMLWGFDIGTNTITTALPGFKMVFGYFYDGQLLIDATWNALWSTMTSVGMAVGGIACGFVSDAFGRRIGLAIACFISAAGVAVEYVASTPGVLLAGKIINGISLGFFLTIGPTYASEIAPVRLRSALISAVNFFITAGQLMAIGIGNTRFTIITPASYKLMFAVQWAFPGAVLILAFIIPESPWFLVKKGRIAAATKSLTRLHNSSYDVQGTVSNLQIAIEREEEEAQNQKSTSYVQCFRGSDWRRTRIACGGFIIQSFTGIAFYSQGLYFLGIAGLSIELSFRLTLMGFGLGLIGTVAGWFLMNYIGRRKLLLVGVCLNFGLLLAVGIAGCFSGSTALTFIGVGINIANLFYAPTVGATTWAISAEVSSGRLRAKTQSLCTITNALISWLLSFVTPYLINTDQANLGGKAGFVWAALSLIGLVWVWFEVPETKDRTFAALDELFANRTPTRKFADTFVVEADHKQTS